MDLKIDNIHVMFCAKMLFARKFEIYVHMELFDNHVCCRGLYSRLKSLLIGVNPLYTLMTY